MCATWVFMVVCRTLCSGTIFQIIRYELCAFKGIAYSSDFAAMGLVSARWSPVNLIRIK